MKRRTVLILALLAIAEGVGVSSLYRESSRLQQETRESERRVARAESRLRLIQAESSRWQPEESGGTGSAEARADPTAAQALLLVQSIADLKAWIGKTRPRPYLPEMSYLKEKEWVEAVRVLGANPGPAEHQKAWDIVRDGAFAEFAPRLQAALQSYADGHDGNFPSSLGELAPYLPEYPESLLKDRFRIVDGALAKAIESKPGALDTDDCEGAVRVSLMGSNWDSNSGANFNRQ